MPKSKNNKPSKAGKTNPRKATPVKRKQVPMAKTANGRNIQRLLHTAGKDMRDYKDWAAMTTGRLITWHDSYNVVGKDGPLAIEGVQLVHLSELHKFVPKPLADSLWNASIGRRVSMKGPQP
jgi:hypothetical protein